MLTMTQIHNIRKLYYGEGKSISQISRETGHDRKTIRMYINREDWNETNPKNSKKEEFPKLDPFKEDIDKWLNDDKQAKRKQRHTAKRVYERLIEKHGNEFICSYRSVAGYVAKRKTEIFGKKPGYLPLEHIPGEAQVDFGDADYYKIAGFIAVNILICPFHIAIKGISSYSKVRIWNACWRD